MVLDLKILIREELSRVKVSMQHLYQMKLFELSEYPNLVVLVLTAYSLALMVSHRAISVGLVLQQSMDAESQQALSLDPIRDPLGVILYPKLQQPPFLHEASIDQLK